MADRDRATRSRPLTFRVQHIPPDITRNSFATFFDSIVDAGGTDNIHLRSLAPSAVSTKQVATIDFTSVPEVFVHKNRTKWEFPLPSSNNYITVDTAFIGFTPLNDTSGGGHDFDCIAISGLQGHAFGSWRRHALPGSTRQFMWLRDQFAIDYPKIRVMIYGYDTQLVDSQSSQTIDDIARTLVIHLKAIGCADYSARPMMIFAHSLGGILVKKALFDLARSGAADEYMLSKIRLAIFFGVPNKGMKIEHLLVMVHQQPNENLVQSLAVDNPYLGLLDDALMGATVYGKIRLVSIYETKASATARLQSDGSWTRDGPAALLVSKDSAILKASRDTDDIFHIDEDHSDLVKFSPDDLSYLAIVNIVRQTFNEVSQHNTRKEVSTSFHSLQSDTVAPRRDRFLERPQAPVMQQHNPQWPNPSKTLVEESISHVDVYKHNAAPVRSGVVQIESYDESAERDLQSLSKSLTFDEIDLRQKAITEAHETTFEWIFGNDVSFMEWIKNGSEVFWIKGKPGSGKSTLMKYLIRHESFRRGIRGTISSKHQLDLWFFFNERGTHLQRTLEGLLRTILLGLIDSDEKIAGLMLRLYRRRLRDGRYEWFLTDLTEAFATILSQTEFDIDLLLFLDALDIHQGHQEEICDWMQNMISVSASKSSRTKVRICFSSRPWTSFLEAFENAPGFALHEHTQHDIKSVAQWRLQEMASDSTETGLSTLLETPTVDLETVVDVVVKHAEGVFLWLRLALNELRLAKDVKTISDLEKAVGGLPSELQEFYLRTVARIPNGDRLRAFIILQLVLRSNKLVYPEELHIASVTAEGNTFQECCNLYHQAVKARKLRPDHPVNASRNLLDFCGGLLELTPRVRSTSKSRKILHHDDDAYIQFAHLTVKSFVESPMFAQTMLGHDRLAMQLNGYSFWLRYELAATSASESRFNELSFHYALMDEKTNGRSAARLIDSIPAQSLEDMFPLVPRIDTVTKETAKLTVTHFVFAVVVGLRLYVRVCLEKFDLQQLQESKPLHAIALFAAMKGWLEGAAGMVSLLLVAGIHAHDRMLGLLPFEILLTCQPNRELPLNPDHYSSETINIARILITQGGQRLDLRIHRCKLIPGHVIYYDRVRAPESSALHIATPSMATMLLEHGADPNMRNDMSMTPLDVWVREGGELYPYYENFVTVVPACEVLLKYGAQLTRQGHRHVLDFVKNLQKLGKAPMLKKRLENLAEMDDNNDVSRRRRRMFRFFGKS